MAKPVTGKWVTMGKGPDARHIPIEPGQQMVTPPTLGVYDYYDDLPENYRVLLDNIAKLYNNIEGYIEDELEVKNAYARLEGTFDDPEAYRQLMELVRHVFYVLATLQTHVANINSTSLKKGIDLKYLYNTISALERQSEEIQDILMDMPQYHTEEGMRAYESQRRVSESLQKEGLAIMSLMQQDYPHGRPRTSRDWKHLEKRALKGYIERSKTVESL